MEALMANAVSTAFLDAFAAAWNRHDTDVILSMMTDDCVFEASRGPHVKGTVYTGQGEVRGGIEEVFSTFPDARWSGPKHFITGDRGVSEWVFTATGPDGARIEVQGCDVFTFRDGKIAVKNSYRKQRTA
jgi:ketosteroid isomerase-like protein